MQCATHPEVETDLGCSRCGKAICPRCLVQTPVGARCRECANVRRLPQYNLSSTTYVRGASAAVVAGTAAGLLWHFFFRYTTFRGDILLAAIIGVGLGFLVGECVAIATNRRAGPPLQIIAAAGVVVAYVVRVSLLLATDEWTLRTLYAFRELEVLAVMATILGAWVASLRVR
jgi:hypothetical protein